MPRWLVVMVGISEWCMVCDEMDKNGVWWVMKWVKMGCGG